MKRIALGFLVAFGLAAAMGAVVYAKDGPYNSNPPVCRSTGPGDWLWWYNLCMYPDDPTWGQA